MSHGCVRGVPNSSTSNLHTRAMMTPRQHTRRVRVGKVEIGGGAPVSVQSMTITDTRDVETTLVQIYQLASEGCDIVRRFGTPCAEALVKSAMEDIKVLQDLDFHDIVISVKASDVPMAVEAYAMISGLVDYPLHVGITEAGTAWAGSIKSATGIGAILARGIGDTIRVSLAAEPVEEVKVGFEILKGLGLRTRGVQLVACPSCGRAEVDIITIAQEVERRLAKLDAPVKGAVMGCAVNGPGEARMADLGVACGRGVGLLFRGGQGMARLPGGRLGDVLVGQGEAAARG